MKKKRVRWSVNDVTQGLMLRTISRRAYQYIRKSNLIPVPAISTLRKWIQHINFEPGIQMPILRVIQANGCGEVSGDGEHREKHTLFCSGRLDFQKKVFHGSLLSS